MGITRDLIEALELAEQAQAMQQRLDALRPIALLLAQAEALLSEGQHGPCDTAWRRCVRDYFSDHQRGQVVNAIRGT